MAVYSVLEPPLRDEGEVEHAGRFAFLRDGFSWPAFLFGPLWMLWHRMWLTLAGYVVVVGGLGVAMRALRLDSGASFAVGVLVALLIGFEAQTLRRFTLRRWSDLGAVVADDREAAERRFFDSWIAGEFTPLPPTVRRVPLAPAVATATPEAPDVIGLFPEPGGKR